MRGVLLALCGLMGFWDEADTEHGSWLDDRIENIWTSTLTTTTRAFEEVGLVRGERCDHEAEALHALKASAIERGGGAVLGVGFCAVSSNANDFTQQGIRTQVFAYGTVVKWVDADGAR
jgi:hypothetical protein